MFIDPLPRSQPYRLLQCFFFFYPYHQAKAITALHAVSLQYAVHDSRCIRSSMSSRRITSGWLEWSRFRCCRQTRKIAPGDLHTETPPSSKRTTSRFYSIDRLIVDTVATSSLIDVQARNLMMSMSPCACAIYGIYARVITLRMQGS